MPADPDFTVVEHMTEVLSPHIPPGYGVVLIVATPDGIVTFGGNVTRETIQRMCEVVAAQATRPPTKHSHDRHFVVPGGRRGR